MTPDAAIDAGIYNVPRSLIMQQFNDTRLLTTSDDDAQYLLGSNPLDIYDYPRVSVSPDEEGIYDDPLDIIDMEIYDYPPDASELGLEDSTSESTRSSTATMSGEFVQTDRGNFVSASDNWKALPVPPLPSNVRPSSFLTVGSISDENQVLKSCGNFITY